MHELTPDEPIEFGPSEAYDDTPANAPDESGLFSDGRRMDVPDILPEDVHPFDNESIDSDSWPYGVEPAAEYTLLPDGTYIDTMNVFYRSYHHNVRTLAHVIAPHIAASHPDEPVVIWELGCSTGKDTASMASALVAAGVEAFSIAATDINLATVELARQPWEGTLETLRAKAADWHLDKNVADCFEQIDATHISLAPSVAQNITFTCADARAEVPFTGTADIVVSNNVFCHYRSVHELYKNQMSEHVDAMLSNVVRSLRPGGLFTFGEHTTVLTDQRLARHGLVPAENIYEVDGWDKLSFYQKTTVPVSPWPRFPLRDVEL
jgi:chemotaxis methyl-accepting protein methylase